MEEDKKKNLKKWLTILFIVDVIVAIIIAIILLFRFNNKSTSSSNDSYSSSEVISSDTSSDVEESSEIDNISLIINNYIDVVNNSLPNGNTVKNIITMLYDSNTLYSVVSINENDDIYLLGYLNNEYEDVNALLNSFNSAKKGDRSVEVTKIGKSTNAINIASINVFKDKYLGNYKGVNVDINNDMSVISYSALGIYDNQYISIIDLYYDSNSTSLNESVMLINHIDIVDDIFCKVLKRIIWD